MLSGALYQLQILEPVTSVNVSGLLPTPTTQDTTGVLPTPRASEWKGIGVKGSKSSLRWAKQGYLTGVIQESDSVPTGVPLHLNPCFVEEMMGYPVGWTDLNA